MRKRYVLDSTGRRAPVPAGDDEPGHGVAGRRRLAGAVLAAAGLLAGGWAVLAWLAPGAHAPAPAAAPVPEHQRSGPLANPWGSAAPATATPADDAAAAARAAAVASAAASAAAAVATTPAGSAASRPFSPPAPEAIRQALRRLRGGEVAAAGRPASAREAVAFVQASLQGGDAAALVATWMAERQCRHFMHWRRIEQWRQRANAQPAAAGARGAGAALLPLCEAMPEPTAVEEALAAAGFPAYTGGGPELTRRPIDLAQAVAVGDPLLLAEVLEATDGEVVLQLLRVYGADARDLVLPEVARAALWLASCTPQDTNSRPSGAGALQRACAEHPALSQACLDQGLCDARDLRDLLLRSMQPGELATAERLGRGLVGRMGR